MRHDCVCHISHVPNRGCRLGLLYACVLCNCVHESAQLRYSWLVSADLCRDNDEEAPVLHVNAGIKATGGDHYVATQTGVTVSQIFLGGSSKPHGQVRLVLDNLQRPYAWPKEYIEEVCRAVIDGYRCVYWSKSKCAVNCLYMLDFL